jgi:ectoine hydroxylase-related dioxygenase (phytanoyl-CoA dioxygenase family)
MKLSADELSTLTLKPETLRLAIQKVQMDGYVLFDGVIPRDRIEVIREAFLLKLDEYRARSQSNRGANRYQMHMPFEEPFIDPYLIEHPLAMPVLEAILGSDCHCYYFASDTALPGSDYQAVHSDTALLYPDTTLSLPAYNIVVNIPLIDVRLEHGPVEIWPGGTHLMPGNLDLKSLAPEMHSELVTMPAGSIVIRDMRMWHRGTPNRSQEIRPQLALIYARAWYRCSDYGAIQIKRTTYDGLSERARRLFRFERVI